MKSRSTQIENYRADIDGLRAVAVLAVVAFHAGVPWLPGGYIGVDVFFVISGYLITGFILREKQEDQFSLVTFYCRRARRIVPALLTVVIATWAVGWWILFSDEYRDLGRYVFASSVFVTNLFLGRELDYFVSAAELKPLLHLWSLAIEEQFYLVWPVTLLVIWKVRGNLLCWIPLLFLMSLSLAIWGTNHNSVTTFYMPYARVWELLLGAWLASVEHKRETRAEGASPLLARASEILSLNSVARNIASVAGILLVVISARFIEWDSGVPGLAAIAPTFGALLLIAAGPHALVNRKFLAQPPIVFVGLISYSLYLWHWPLFSFVRIVRVGELPPVLATGAVALSFLLAILTWRYIEQPIRHGRFLLGASGTKPDHRALLRWYAGGLGICAVLGLATYELNGIPSRMSSQAADVLKERTWPAAWQECFFTNSKSFTAREICRSSWNSTPRVAVLGDSHAFHYFPGVAQYLGKRGATAIMLARGGCPPIPGLRATPFRNCEEFYLKVIDYLKAHGEIKTVILAARFTLFVEGTGFHEGARYYKLRSDRYPDLDTNRDVAAAGLDDAVHQLIQLGKKVVILLQVPELPADVPKCYARKMVNCVGLKKDVLDRQRQSRQIIESVSRKYPEVCIFDPVPDLCGVEGCDGKGDGKIIYVDNNHLNLDGSYYVSRFFDFDRCLPKSQDLSEMKPESPLEVPTEGRDG